MIINKPTKIFLIIFSAILIVITAVTIIYTRLNNKTDESQVIIEEAPKIEENKIEINDDEVDTVKPTNLNDTYNYNLLEIKYNTDKENNVSVKYPQISNLNNSSVQQKINDEIRNRISRILSSNNFRTNSDSTAYVDAKITSNFSDVLSVKIFVQFNKDYNKNYGINFNLTDGEKIAIKDLFISDAPIKNIITFSAYKTIAVDYYTNEGISNDFYTNVESELLSFLVDYNDGKVTEFSFSPNVIELYREGKTIKINMVDYASYIAIYNRYKSQENLYGSNIELPQNIPVFVKRPEVMYDLYNKVSDTCYLDVVIYNVENTEFTKQELKIIEDYKNNLLNRLNDIKTESNLYYSLYVTVFRAEENERDLLVFNEDEKYASTQDDFINNIYNEIVNEQRNLSNEDKVESKINVLNKNMINANVVQQKFDIETGKNFNELMEEIERQRQEEIERQRQEEIDSQNQNLTTNEVTNENVTGNTTENVLSNEINNNTVTDNNTVSSNETEGNIDAVVTF